jgi:multidrug transporter EmrE-like cation transporter
MNRYKERFSMWSAVFGWAVQAVIIAGLIGAAFGVLSMTPPQYTLGQAFFTVAGIIAVARVGWWLGFEHSQHHSWQRMLLFSFVLFGIIGCACMQPCDG